MSNEKLEVLMGTYNNLVSLREKKVLEGKKRIKPSKRDISLIGREIRKEMYKYER